MLPRVFYCLELLELPSKILLAKLIKEEIDKFEPNKLDLIKELIYDLYDKTFENIDENDFDEYD